VTRLSQVEKEELIVPIAIEKEKRRLARRLKSTEYKEIRLL
jgi:hypothetical protein